MTFSQIDRQAAKERLLRDYDKAALRLDNAYQTYETALRLLGGCLNGIPLYVLRRCPDFYGSYNLSHWCKHCRTTKKLWTTYRHESQMAAACKSRLAPYEQL